VLPAAVTVSIGSVGIMVVWFAARGGGRIFHLCPVWAERKCNMKYNHSHPIAGRRGGVLV
jgi:hypothetical protein